jgi:ATP-dependent DNA helicase RecG
VVIENAPEEHYRNQFLATAMFNLKMVDTAGGGIRKMFNFQRERFFPMPEYDLSGGKVKVTITGKVLDLDYARVLAKIQSLELHEIIMLDKVQKKKLLSETEIKHLRSKRLIEGRKPNFHISSNLAEKTGQKAEYIKARGFEDDYYKSLILKYIDQYKQASREDIDNLLLDKLPGVLDDQQRKNKIRNLLYAMSKKEKTIENQGTGRYPKWVRTGKFWANFRQTLDKL